MSEFAKYIMAAIEWAVAPLIIFGILLYSLLILPQMPRGIQRFKIRRAAHAGSWAGLIPLAIFIISQKKVELVFQFPTYSVKVLPLLLATIAGLCFKWALDLVKNSRGLGIFSLLLVATSSITLYSYFFLTPLRSTLVFIALGVLFGILLHRAAAPLFPGAIPKEKTDPQSDEKYSG